jgi:hypothetical protein
MSLQEGFRGIFNSSILTYVNNKVPVNDYKSIIDPWSKKLIGLKITD